MDIELLEKFKKKVEVESTYDKLCTRKAIDALINYFDVDVKKQKFQRTIPNPKEIAISYYKQYYPDYYKIIEDGLLSGKIQISDKLKSTVTYLDTGEANIKPFNNDADLFEIIHELGHYIDRNLCPHFIEEYKLLGETPAFYYEKDFEKIYEDYYNELICIRKNSRLFREKEMLQVIKYMLEYEDYYKKYGRIDEIIDQEKIELIMGYHSNNTVNYYLRYPVANLFSTYMIINGIQMKQNIDDYIINNIDLFKVMEDKDVRKSIMLK